MPISAFRRPCRGLRRGAGVPGEERPDTLPAGLGRSGRVKGPCPRPYGAAGRTNPLTRPSLKTRQRPAQGLEGALSEWMGVKARAATAQRLGLDAQERPQRSGLVAGVLFPQPPATWRTPPEGRRRRSCSALLWGLGVHPEQVPCNRPRVAQRIGAGGGARNRLAGFVYPARDLSNAFPAVLDALGRQSGTFEHCKRSLRKRPCFASGIGTEAPCRRLAWIYSVNMSSVSGSRSGASCGACWPPSITPLIPAFAIRFLRSRSSVAMWFLPLPRQPNSGLSL